MQPSLTGAGLRHTPEYCSGEEASREMGAADVLHSFAIALCIASILALDQACLVERLSAIRIRFSGGTPPVRQFG